MAVRHTGVQVRAERLDVEPDVLMLDIGDVTELFMSLRDSGDTIRCFVQMPGQACVRYIARLQAQHAGNNCQARSPCRSRSGR